MSRRHTNADLAAILIKQGHPVDFDYKPNRAPRDPNRQDESKDQQELVKWWSVMHGQYKLPECALMAFPLQGARTPKNGARMKAEGMRKGTPDMLLAAGRKGFHGLWIENKTEKGVVSAEQKAIILALKKENYCVHVCRSPSEAARTIMEYLSP